GDYVDDETRKMIQVTEVPPSQRAISDRDPFPCRFDRLMLTGSPLCGTTVSRIDIGPAYCAAANSPDMPDPVTALSAGQAETAAVLGHLLHFRPRSDAYIWLSQATDLLSIAKVPGRSHPVGRECDGSRS